jgi:long-subunit fatty acid transport protein
MQSWTQSFGNTAYKLGAGIEYSYNDMFNLRAGYTFDGDDIGNSKYITAGVGLKYELFEFNFAYLVPSGATKTQSAMANTLRFGLIYHFQSKK